MFHFLKRSVAAPLLLLFSVLPSAAQIGEARNTIALGITGGVSMNSIAFDPTIKQQQHLGPTMGVALRITSEKYFKTYCALQLELNYARLGWKEDIYSYDDTPLPDTYSRHHDYLQLPLLARLGWGRETRGLMGYILLGPQVGYCLHETAERSDVWTTNAAGNPDRPNSMYAQYDLSMDHRFDYGITGGAGVEVHTPIGHFNLDARYYYGLSDIFSNSKKDVFSRSNNGTIMVKLGYFIDIKK